MNIHREISFEDEICEHLVSNGWLHDRTDAQRYDRARALYAPDIIEWMKISQPKTWEAIAKVGEAALLYRVRKQMDARGTLDVLRHGIDMNGVRGTLKLAEFKPALADLAVAHLAPIASEMRRLKAAPDYIDGVLADGAERASAIAGKVLSDTYEAVGLLRTRAD